ncbi:MAG: hypothetical protein KDA25_04095 [Phycisphaerales bacterium]|nr:hypothetical protein [Phycisphaerales bacterium]
MMRIGATSVAATAVTVAMGLTGAASADVLATSWIGPDTGNWNVAGNWSLLTVPTNGADQYLVTIDTRSGANVLIDFTPTIDALTIGAGDAATLQNGRSLTFPVGPLTIDGTLELGSTGSFTNLVVSSDVLFTGAGVLQTSGSLNDRLYSNSNTRITIDAPLTFEGAATIGLNQTRLTNLGLMRATLPAGINLDLIGTDNVNAGIIESDGGTFSINSSTIDNTGGIIRALNGSTTQISSSTITSGEWTTDGDPASVVRVTNSTADDLLVTGLVVAPNGSSITILDAITVDDVLRLESTGSFTQLIGGGGDILLTGTGLITGTDHANNRIYSAANNRVTIDADLVVTGAFRLGLNQTRLTNLGILEASLPAGLTLDLVGSDNVNDSILRANGGTLSVDGTALDNTNGRIEATNGSEVTFSSSEIIGGELTTDALPGSLLRQTAANTFDSVLVTGPLVLNNGTSLNVDHQITIEDDVHLDSSGAFTQIVTSSVAVDTLLTGSGAITTSSHLNNRLYSANNGRITVDADLSIDGSMQIGVNQTRLTNLGLIDATLAPGITIDLVGADNFNSSTMRANGGDLRLTGTTIDNTGGILRAMAGSEVQYSSSDITGGILDDDDDVASVHRLVGGSTMDAVLVDTRLLLNNGVTLNVTDTLTIDGSVEVASTGAFTQIVATGDAALDGTGTITLNHGNARIYSGSGGLITFGPDLTVRGGGKIGVNQTQIRNEGTIIADLAAALTIDLVGAGLDNLGVMHVTGDGALDVLPSTFTNSGDIIIDETRKLDRSSGDVTQTAGQTVVDGEFEIDAGALRIQGGYLRGDGLVDGTVSIEGGTVAPGSSAGSLDVDGTFTQTVAGRYEVELGGLVAGDEHDTITVTGAAAVSGALDISALGAFVPQIGDEFVILTAASVTGRYGCVDGTLRSGFYTVVYDDTTITLVVASTPAKVGDFDGDGIVGPADLAFLLGAWGDCTNECCPADLGGDGSVGPADLAALLSNWG